MICIDFHCNVCRRHYGGERHHERFAEQSIDKRLVVWAAFYGKSIARWSINREAMPSEGCGSERGSARGKMQIANLLMSQCDDQLWHASSVLFENAAFALFGFKMAERSWVVLKAVQSFPVLWDCHDLLLVDRPFPLTLLSIFPDK